MDTVQSKASFYNFNDLEMMLKTKLNLVGCFRKE